MRKLVLKMSMTLDGFVGGPNGEADWIFRTLDAATAALKDAPREPAGLPASASSEAAQSWARPSAVFEAIRPF
jgi:hypothetical protein